MSTNRSRQTRTLRNAILWLAGLFVGLMFVVPVVWAFSASLRSTGQPWARNPQWMPSPIAWENYGLVFDTVDAQRFALNSLFVVAVTAPLTVLFASLAGFAIAEMSRQWRRSRFRHTLSADVHLHHSVQLSPLRVCRGDDFVDVRNDGRNSLDAVLGSQSLERGVPQCRLTGAGKPEPCGMPSCGWPGCSSA